MKQLANQLTNFELSTKLKELGIEQESLFYYYTSGIHVGNITCVYYEEDCGLESIDKRVLKDELCSAFISSELLEMLPESIDDKYLLEISKYNEEYVVYYVDRVSDITDYCFNKGQDDIDVDDKNLCNALAKMLIYLKENNLIIN